MKIPLWVKISSGILLGLILCIGTFIYWFFFLTHPFPLPELARDLPAEFAAGSSVFNDRVQSRFKGTQQEAVIVEELRKEGFTIIDGQEERRKAVLSGSRFPCSLKWEVSWLADNGGMISDLAGTYNEAGCL